MTNPYDPYAGEPLPPAPPPLPVASASPAPFTFEGAFSAGFGVFKTQYPLLLAAGAIMIGIQILTSLVQLGLDRLHPCLGSLWNLGVLFAVSIPMMPAPLLLGARAARGGKIDLNDFLLGYSRLGWLVLWMVVVGCVTVVALIPAIVVLAVAHSAAPDNGVLLAAIPLLFIYLPLFLYFSTRFYPVLGMLADPRLPRMNCFEAAKTSWSLTRTNWLPLLGLVVLVGLMLFCSIFLICVGLLFLGYPLYFAITGCAYAMLVEPLVGAHGRPV